MVAASRADALAKAAATPLNLHQLWLTGLPRHDLVTRSLEPLPADLRAPGAGAARPARWPPAAGAVAAARTPPSHRSPTSRAGLARGVVPAATTRSSGCAREPVDRAGQPHPDADADRGLGALRTAACPTPRWCSGWPMPWSPTTPTRPSTSCSPGDHCCTALPNRPTPDDEPLGYYPPAASLPGPCCTSFDELDRRSRRRSSSRRTPSGRPPTERAVDLAFAHTDDLSGWRLVERIRRQYVDG